MLSVRLVLLCIVCFFDSAARSQTHDSGWPTYGGDPGGQRFSYANQLTRENISRLRPAWTYHTHALESTNQNVKRSDFEATPILFRGSLLLTTPFDRVISLDAVTGREQWIFDPHIPDDILAANYTSRGVAVWNDPRSGKDPCRSRVFVATLDARLISIDAKIGVPCSDFGQHGQVDLKANVATRKDAPYRFFGNTSPPTVVGDVVVVGSAVGDNQAVDVEPGLVRGFDVRSGRLLWTWDSMPWARQQEVRTGAGNAWGVSSADVEHGLVYVATGSPSPDFFGGLRPGNNADANSLVAIEATTGRKVWAFQLVHHDIWDYDVVSEPLLFQFHGTTPAVAIASKVGVLFVLNRLTGEPLYPVEERAVPASDVPGEHASPTQPFTTLPPLTRQSYRPEELAGHSPVDTDACHAQLKDLRYEGVYTPPSVRGTLQFPGSLGGVNWGSMALNPLTGVLYANTNGSVYEIRLIPNSTVQQTVLEILRGHRRWFVVGVTLLVLLTLAIRKPVPSVLAVTAGALLVLTALYGWHWPRPSPESAGVPMQTRGKFINSPDSAGEVSQQSGTPYRIYRKVLQDADRKPCALPPWGKTVAVNLNTGKFEWERPLGTMVAGAATGTVNFGAPILTAGGLLFTAASREPVLRAMDARTGEELWKGELPVPAQSTPMTYEIKGRQFVVVDAGGHGGLETPLGDSVVAFALDGDRTLAVQR